MSGQVEQHGQAAILELENQRTKGLSDLYRFSEWVGNLYTEPSLRDYSVEASTRWDCTQKLSLS